MITHPNCKINLGLHVVGRRPDGYHDLETIFLPVRSLCDELEIIPLAPAEAAAQREAILLQEGIALDGDPADNLCLRAWRLLHEKHHVPAVRIRLRKLIPFGAGLGGGSSDAAFTLRMLNQMFGLGLSASQLEAYAATIGADCPFFIRNQAAYATGIGERLEPLAEGEQMLEAYEVRVVVPAGEAVSTREAYSGLDRSRFGLPRPDLRQAVRQPIASWRDLVVNDFEKSVFPEHPAIAALKERLYAEGAAYASMSGSGSAVFGFFPRSI